LEHFARPSETTGILFQFKAVMSDPVRPAPAKTASAAEPTQQTDEDSMDPITSALSASVKNIGIRKPIATNASDEGIPCVASGIDSGYVSQSSTPGKTSLTHDNSYDVPLRTGLRTKVTRLKQFQNPISEATLNRFSDLKDLFEQPLYEYICESKTRSTAISMKLKVLGTDKANAKPFVVILCNASISKKVKRYFNQPMVKKEFKLDHCDPEFPVFEILVLDKPPVRMADGLYYQKSIGLSHTVTPCGMVIKVERAGTARLATIGGVIKVVDNTGACALYGMTAGHILVDDAVSDPESDPGLLNDDNDTETSEWGDEEFELDLEAEDFEHDLKAEEPQAEEGTEWLALGHIVASSQGSTSNGPDLDWALVKIDHLDSRSSNTLAQGSTVSSSAKDKMVWIEYLSHPIHTTRSVVLVGGVSGIKDGTLSMRTSYLMMSPGTSFADTYSLSLKDGSSKHTPEILSCPL
jgi:hypothetical protein